MWSQAVDAGLPVLFHVGVADRVLPKAHANNGLPTVHDFHGGDDNLRSISYMATPHGPMQALAMLILDGVLERSLCTRFHATIGLSVGSIRKT